MKKFARSHSCMSLLYQMAGKVEEEDPLIGLLIAIDADGSINRAAKKVGLSYKAAWERVETINNLSPNPLILRQTGGSGGGGTVLTQEGQDFVAKALLLRQHQARLLAIFNDSPQDALNVLQTLKGMEMKISARNVWLGNVTSIDTGAVNSVVTVALKGEDTIVAVITENSVQRLRLETGSEVLAIVKAPSVMLSHGAEALKLSARNILQGKISRIVGGVVNDEVVVELSGGNTVTSILTSESVRRLDLTEGMHISAIIKASSVLLAIP